MAKVIFTDHHKWLKDCLVEMVFNRSFKMIIFFWCCQPVTGQVATNRIITVISCDNSIEYLINYGNLWYICRVNWRFSEKYRVTYQINGFQCFTQITEIWVSCMVQTCISSQSSVQSLCSEPWHSTFSEVCT